MTQAERVAQYMRDFGSITSFEAFSDLGITRLAARIGDLKKRGFVIGVKTEKSVNRYGETAYFARYSIVEEAAS